MVYHILNGDSLAYSFADAKMEGAVIVAREALIEGDVSGDTLRAFWQSRAAYLGLTEAAYHKNVAQEFEKILHAPDNAEFNLWFEYDLFCQVNMWFVVSILHSLPVQKKVYAVYTSYLNKTSKHFWNGYGPANAGELAICFADRVALHSTDLQLGDDLWRAYKTGDLAALNRLAENAPPAFPYVQEVVQAHADRFPTDGTKGRPERVIEDIIQHVSADFHQVCAAFWNRESIYGFGDTQLKHLYDKVMRGR